MLISASDWDYLKERATGFVGREWLFARIRDFLNGPPGVFLIRGDPGAGKTAVAARLIQDSSGRDVGDHECRRPSIDQGSLTAVVVCRQGRADALELTYALSEQLAHAVPAFRDELLAVLTPEIRIGDVHVQTGDVTGSANVVGVRLDLGVLDDSRAFARAITFPLKRLQERDNVGRLVLLVDAVDEAGSSGLNTIARGLATLEGVHLIATTRPDPAVLAAFRGAKHQLDLLEDAPEDDEDLLAYVAARLRGSGHDDAVRILTDRIVERASGNFLYATYVVGSLLDNNVLPHVDATAAQRIALPTGGLRGVYEDYLDRQIAGDARAWTDKLRPVLAPLCVALGEGLTVEQLTSVAARVVGRTFSVSEVRDVIHMLGQLIDGPRPDGPLRVYHQSFARFLLDPDENSIWPIDANEAHLAIAKGLGDDSVPRYQDGTKDWSQATDYVTSYLASHAATAGVLDQYVVDAGYLVAADPHRLASALSSLDTPHTHRIRQMYRRVFDALIIVPHYERACYVEMAARQADLLQLADEAARIDSPRDWSARWARWRLGAEHVILGQHDSRVSAVALAEHAGRVIAFSAGDEALRVWDPDVGMLGEIWTDDWIVTVALAEVDGRPVGVSGGSDGAVRLWDLDSLAQRGQAMCHDDRVNAVTVGLLDGRLVVASGSDDKTVRIWELKSGTPLGPCMQADDEVQAVRLGSMLGRPTVFGITYEGAAWKWDLATRTPERLRSCPGRRPKSMCLGEVDDEPIALTGTGYGVVWCWGLAASEEDDYTPTYHDDEVLALSCGERGGRALGVSGGEDGVVHVFALSDGDELNQSLVGHEADVRAVAVREIGARCMVVSGSDDGTVRLWHVDTSVAPIEGPIDPVSMVTVAHMDGKTLVVTGGIHGVRIWEATSGAQVGELLSDRWWVPVVAVAEVAGRWAALTGGQVGDLSMWDLRSGERYGEEVSHGNYVNSAAFGTLDRRLVVVSGGMDCTVRVWDMTTGEQCVEPFRGHRGEVTAVAVTTLDGMAIIVSGGHGTLCVGRLDSQGEAKWLGGHTGTVDAIVTCEIENRPIGLVSSNGTVRAWDLRDGAQVFETLIGHTGRVPGLTVGEVDGRLLLVTGGSDRTVRIWERDGRCLTTINVGSSVSSLAWMPPGAVAVGAPAGVMVIDITCATSTHGAC